MKRHLPLRYLLVIVVFYAHQVGAQSPFCFTSSSDNIIPTGSGARSVAVKDFNGDQIPDVVVTNFNTGTVSFLAGRGERSFRPPETVAQFSQPFIVMSEDFNNDGHYDLAVSAAAAPLAILLGDGTGKFESSGTYPDFEQATILKSADFNKDGKADIIGYRPLGSAISVMFGDGTGKFGITRDIHQSEDIRDIIVTDFTSDNVPDIAFIDGLKLHITTVDGTGSFTDNEMMSVNSVYFINGDFNGDNNQDIFIENDKLYLGDGAGGFTSQFSVPQLIHEGSMVVGYFNDDEILDVAGSDSFGVVRILFGTSATSFNASTNYSAGGTPMDVVAKDMDDDGRMDFIFPEFDVNGGVLVLYNEIQTFSSTESFQVYMDGFGLFADDFNSDGKKDVITADATREEISVLVNSTNGFQKVTTSGLTFTFGSKAIGDYNGDGKLDLAGHSIFNGDVTLIYGDGDGTFTNGPVFTYNAGDLTGADFNNDGNNDLAITLKSTNFIGIRLSNGAGGFTSVDKSAGVFATTIRTGDFNGDAKLDIICLADGDNKVVVFPGNGNGTFGNAINMSTGIAMQSAIYPVDLNNDGKSDLVTGDPEDTNGFRTFINTGSAFNLTSTIDIDQWINGFAFGDFDGDGFNDLAFGSRNERSVSIYRGKGNGTLYPPVLFATGSTDGLVATDLDNDGTTDLVAGGSIIQMITVLRNNTAGITTSGAITNCVGAITLRGPENGFNYQWNTPGGSSSEQAITTDVRGTYTLIVSNSSESCKSIAEISIQGKPSLPTVSIVNTTCSQPTGSLIIDKQENTDTYSFNSGANFQPSNVKTSLTPGEYHLVIRNDDGCISEVATAVIDPQPTPPAVPVVEASDPTCDVHTGSIVVTMQKEGDTYSFDNGQSFQGINIQDGLTPGDYKILIRRALDCISDTTEVTINQGPEIPAKPNISFQTQTGSVSLLSSSGFAYEWSFNGFPIENSNEQGYDPKETGSYSVVVFSADGCRSVSSDAVPVVYSGDIDESTPGFYPNPAEKYIYYQTSGNSVSSMIYTSGGTQIAIKPTRTSEELIYDVSGLTPGVYVLKITVDDTVRTIRWVKR